MRISLVLALLPFALLAGCAGDVEAPKPTLVGDIAIEPWSLPAAPGTAQPDLIVAPDGRLILSWISSTPGRRPALQLAEWTSDRGWDPVRTVAVGNAMVVNWADTPHVATTADRALWAHWLQKSPDNPEAYSIMLVRSMDHGMNWSAPLQVNTDAVPAEHGFVSLWAQSDSSLGLAWLDGRKRGLMESAHAGHDGAKADPTRTMTLRAAVFDGELQRSAETEIDGDTCTCCQTAAAAVPGGAVVAYRDHDSDDIRDIAVVRFDGNTWSKPDTVHADGWNMAGCPVSGPAIGALDGRTAVAWYTAAKGENAVKLAISTDKNARFATAAKDASARGTTVRDVVVDRGPAVSGRVAVALDARQIWVVWMREERNAQSLWLARYAPDLSKELQRTKLVDVRGNGRGTGTPKLALAGAAAHVVWTDVADGTPQLKGVRIVAKTAAR